MSFLTKFLLLIGISILYSHQCLASESKIATEAPEDHVCMRIWNLIKKDVEKRKDNAVSWAKNAVQNPMETVKNFYDKCISADVAKSAFKGAKIGIVCGPAGVIGGVVYKSLAKCSNRMEIFKKKSPEDQKKYLES